MPLGTGYGSRCGVGKESEWGSIVAPTELMSFIPPESINENYDWGEKEMLISKAGRRDADILGIKCAGGLVLEANHQSCDIPLAVLFGGGGGTPTGEGPFVHTLSLAEDIERSISLHFEKAVNLHSIGGVKFNGGRLVGDSSQVKWEFDAVAKYRDRSTTHRAALTALSDLGKPDLLFQQCIMRLGDLNDALDSNDAIDISNFTLSINHNLAIDQQTTTSQKYIMEPVRSGRREVTLTITLPRFTEDAQFAWLAAATLLQCDIIFTSGAYIFKLEMPTLLIKEDTAPIGDAGLIPQEISFQCYRNRGNSYITETEEVVATITNDRDAAIWSA